jgi:hypothetical protein
MKRGLYRIRGAEGRPDDVRVDLDGIEAPVEETIYRARGYLPVVDDLQWQEDYFSVTQSAARSNETAEAAQKAAREQARQEFRARFRNSR